MDEQRKGKAGKYCPVRTLTAEGSERKCGDYCAWFCVGLNSCVLHGINNNLRLLANDAPIEEGEKEAQKKQH